MENRKCTHHARLNNWNIILDKLNSYEQKIYHYIFNNFSYFCMFSIIFKTISYRCIFKFPKNCIFYIKPRLYESWWIKRIKEIVKEVSGKNIDEINNLFITNKPAYDLINSSVNVIGFNSTVLIESVIQGCKPIIPIFDEAIGKHKKHVYLTKFLNQFSIASSEEKLSKLINFYLKKNNIKKVNLKNIRSFLNYYIYYTKPCSSSRTMQLIKKISSKYQ